MSVYIELQEDPFVEAFEDEHEQAKKIDLTPRRPLRGIQLRRDQVAYITIIDKYGKHIPLVDAGGEEDELGVGRSVRYTNFLVQSYAAQRKEKQQIIQTFGEDFTFFYGEQPKIYNVNGILMHTADFNWRNEFLYNYDNYLRGTKLVERKARAYIIQGGLMWEGYLIGFAHQESSAQPYHVSFSFQFLLTAETIVDNVGDVSFPQFEFEGYTSQPWAFRALLEDYERNRSVLPRKTNFAQDLAAFIQTGSAGFEQDFVRASPLRSKISDNTDEYLGGATLTPLISGIELAKARRMLGIRRALYLWREQYLRAKFVMDSAQRLTRGQQSATAKAFGTFFTIQSIADAVLPG